MSRADDPETDYEREPGYADRYRDHRFDAGTGTGHRTNAREVKAIEDLLELCRGQTSASPQPNGLWLDVPCGAGRLSGLLPGRVVLVDRDENMVRAADEFRARICASIHRLPFGDDSFDGALCMRLLHHIPSSEERRRILDELRRVTRGPVILSFFHSVSLQNLRRQIGRSLGRRRTGRCAVRWRVLREDLCATGFEVVATRPLARFVSEQWVVLAR